MYKKNRILFYPLGCTVALQSRFMAFLCGGVVHTVTSEDLQSVKVKKKKTGMK